MTDWQPINTAPKGQRVRVGHVADRSSMKVDTICPTFGTLTDEGWHTSSYFLIPYGRRDAVIERTPTHWMFLADHRAQGTSGFAHDPKGHGPQGAGPVGAADAPENMGENPAQKESPK